uniref:Uncharacterized protein n=1 Tax=Aegilops tauschii TaxID=37682 RepID=M8CRV4_AEGTA
MPIKAALLLNYDPTGPSRLFPMVAEQEGAKFTAVDLQPSMDFFRRNNLQTEFFSIGSNQWTVKPSYFVISSNFVIASYKFLDVVTSIHEHWFSARCVNTTQPGGEGVIIMQIGAYLLVSMAGKPDETGEFQRHQRTEETGLFINLKMWLAANNLEGLLKSMKGFSKGNPLCLFHPPAGCVESEPGAVQTD